MGGCPTPRRVHKPFGVDQSDVHCGQPEISRGAKDRLAPLSLMGGRREHPPRYDLGRQHLAQSAALL